MTFAQAKEKALLATVYQRGAADAAGWERDAEWRKDARRARGWAQLAEALPYSHPMGGNIRERAGW